MHVLPSTLKDRPIVSLLTTVITLLLVLALNLPGDAASGSGTGLTAQYYNQPEIGSLVLTRVDPTVNFSWGTGAPDPAVTSTQYSVHWSGQIQPLYSETYTFHVTNADAARLLVNGQEIVSDLGEHAAQEDTGTITLVAGQKYTIQLVYFQYGLNPSAISLSWSSTSQTKQIVPQSQLYPTTPVNSLAAAGIPVGPGTTDATTHQVVRTSKNYLYVFGNGSLSYPGTPNSILGVFKGNQPGTASSFINEDPAHAPGNDVNAVSIAIDGNDTIHVVWIDGAGLVNYAPFSTATDTWGATQLLENANLPNPTQGDVGVDIAADANDKLHAVWNVLDGTGTRHLHYANTLSGSWSTPIQVDDVDVKNAWHPTMAFAPNGDLLFAWLDGQGGYSQDGIVRTRVRHANGVIDPDSVIPGETATVGIDNSPSLIITADGTKHITFDNQLNQIRYWYNSGSGWQGDEQPPVQVTHDPIIGPDGNGGLYIYGHGTPSDNYRGEGNNQYRFHKPKGATAWGPWTEFASGPLDDANNPRWAQFFFNYPKTVDYVFWSAPLNGGSMGYTLFAATDGDPASNPPAAPQGLTASPAASAINLAWTALPGTIGGYNVYRGTKSGGEGTTPINASLLTSASYTDTAVSSGTKYYYVVRAVNVGGVTGAASNEASASTFVFKPFLQINSGGPAVAPFAADSHSTGGTTATATQTVTTAGVAGAAPEAVYQSQRQGTFYYYFGGVTKGGVYTVRLHFAETTYTQSGQRVFNVSVNGAQVLSNFDIFAAGGANTAVVRDFVTTASSSGIVKVSFQGVVGIPVCSGIELASGGATAPPASIFTTQSPAAPNDTDNRTYELGCKFQSNVAAHIQAIRYWRATSETGNHIGHIWSSSGQLIATVAFTGETASGWQQAALSAPLSISANTTYIVSVNTNGYFVDTQEGLQSPVTNGPLSTIADGANGLYGDLGTFPTNSYMNSNYFTDAVVTVP